MKSIKILTWESFFIDNLNSIRSKELSDLYMYLISSSLAQLVWRLSPLIASATTLISHALFSKTGAIDAATAFTVLTMFNGVLRYPLFILPKLFVAVIEAKVSLKRMEIFLNEPDILNTDSTIASHVGFTDNASFDYKNNISLASNDFSLQDLNFMIPNIPSFVVIVGPTGCGKSSLLLALLGGKIKKQKIMFVINLIIF